MPLSAASYDPAQRIGARNGTFLGGTIVTQITNRTTGVTIGNSISGVITTNNASLAAETAATFTVTAPQVFADDVVIVAMAGGSNGGNTTVSISSIAAGSFQVTVANQNAAGGAAETGAILLNFLIMKASQNS